MDRVDMVSPTLKLGELPQQFAGLLGLDKVGLVAKELSTVADRCLFCFCGY